MRAAQGFRQDAVNQAKFAQAVRRQPQGLCGFRSARCILPQNRSAAFGADHRVDGILKNINRIGHGNCQGTARAAFTDDRSDNRRSQVAHLKEVVADRFRLAALFGADAGISPRGIHKSEDRKREFFSHTHQAQRFAIAFRTAHAEIAHHALFGVTSLLVADHNNGLTGQTGQAPDNRRVVGVGTVAVQFMKVGENHLHVVKHIGTVRMAGNKRSLPRRELRVGLFQELFGFAFELFDFG